MDTEKGYPVDAGVEEPASVRGLYGQGGAPSLLELLASAVRPHAWSENLEPRDRGEDTGGSGTASGDVDVRRGVL